MIDRVRRGSNDEGVALVVTAMVITGLIVTSYLTYQVTVLPVMEAEAEVNHVRDVSRQLAALKTELDRQLENRTLAPVATSVSLGRERSSIFSAAPGSGALFFDPNGKGVDLWAKRFLLQESDGASLTGHPESWQEMEGTSKRIEDVSEVVSLRLKLNQVGRDNAGDHVSIEVTDADGAYAGEFRLCVAKHAPDWDIHYRVEDADGDEVHNNAEPYFNTQEYAPFWIDVMDETFRFDRVLAVTATPMDLTVRIENDAGDTGGCPGEGSPGTGQDDLDADMAITYVQHTDEGTVIRGGGGVEQDDYHKAFVGGTLRFGAEGGVYASQHLELESGAVVLSQSDGAIFEVEPHFRAALVNNLVSLTVTVPGLTGPTASISGTGTSSVYTTAGALTRFAGQSSNLTLSFETAYPDLWAELWRDELTDLGLIEGTQFDITTTTDEATLDVWGLIDPTPASTTYDVFLWFRHANVQVRIDG